MHQIFIFVKYHTQYYLYWHLCITILFRWMTPFSWTSPLVASRIISNLIKATWWWWRAVVTWVALVLWLTANVTLDLLILSTCEMLWDTLSPLGKRWNMHSWYQSSKIRLFFTVWATCSSSERAISLGFLYQRARVWNFLLPKSGIDDWRWRRPIEARSELYYLTALCSIEK